MDDSHEDLMKRHAKRRETNFVPYHERRSEGALKIQDDGARVTLEMEVSGLGVLVITADAKYSQIAQQYKWNSKATVSGSLRSLSSSLPDSLLRRVV